MTIESKPMKLDSFKSRWSNTRYKDELIGVIVRVFEPGGEMVYEYRDQVQKIIYGLKARVQSEVSLIANLTWLRDTDRPVRGFTAE